MKKNILYLLAFFAVIFTSCNPLKDEINNIKLAPKTLTLTLTAADYGLLPKENYAQKALYFNTTADANEFISIILNAKFAPLADGNKALVTYNSSPAQVKPADSLLSSTGAVPTQYLVLAADYSAINGNANQNFTAANVIKFLDAKFPVKVENQLIVLNYFYFESGATTSAGVQVNDTFLYLKGAWVKAYQVTQAQYVSAGKLSVFNFGSADEPNLNAYFNTFLKSDASVSGKAKIGDVKYVSFAFFSSSKTYQRIKALVFDGTNWGTKSVPVGPLAFLKKKGTWIPDPTVYVTLNNRVDFAVLDKSGVATEAAIANAIPNSSFAIDGSGNNWTEEQIMKALILILNTKFASAPVDETVVYKVTYRLFNKGISTTVKSFAKTSTGFVFVPETE